MDWPLYELKQITSSAYLFRSSDDLETVVTSHEIAVYKTMYCVKLAKVIDNVSLALRIHTHDDVLEFF